MDGIDRSLIFQHFKILIKTKRFLSKASHWTEYKTDDLRNTKREC
jgi:hypothetical protein